MSRLYQPPLLAIDPLIKISEVERILELVFKPVPSRPTLVSWIEDGTLDGIPIGKGREWHVYESSLTKLIRATQGLGQEKLAA